MNDNEFIFVKCETPFIQQAGTQVDRFGRNSNVVYLKGELEREVAQGRNYGKVNDLQLEKERINLL